MDSTRFEDTLQSTWCFGDTSAPKRHWLPSIERFRCTLLVGTNHRDLHNRYFCQAQNGELAAVKTTVGWALTGGSKSEGEKPFYVNSYLIAWLTLTKRSKTCGIYNPMGH